MGAIFPTSAQIRPVNPVLQSRLRGFFNADDSYIAEDVFPTLSNVAKTGTIMDIALASGFGDISDSLVRAAKSRYHRSLGPQLGTATWNCEEYGDEAQIDLQQLEDADIPIDLEALESKVAIENVRIWQERRAADLLFNTTTFSNNVTLAAATQFSDPNSDPIGVIDTAVNTVFGLIGKDPNTVIVGRQPWRTMLKSASFLSFRPSNEDRNMLTKEQLRGMLKGYFGVEHLHIGTAQRNTAALGQTVVLAPIWGDMIWIGYMDYGNPGVAITDKEVKVDASAALRFLQTDLVSEEYEEPQTRSKVQRHRHIMDEVVVSANSAYIVNDVTA